MCAILASMTVGTSSKNLTYPIGKKKTLRRVISDIKLVFRVVPHLATVAKNLDEQLKKENDLFLNVIAFTPAFFFRVL